MLKCDVTCVSVYLLDITMFSVILSVFSYVQSQTTQHTHIACPFPPCVHKATCPVTIHMATCDYIKVARHSLQKAKTSSSYSAPEEDQGAGRYTGI